MGYLSSKNNLPRILSVDFGESFIKIAFLEKKQNTYHLLAYGLLEFGATQKNSADISHFLRQLLENNSIKDKEVLFSISDPDAIFIKKLDLPQSPPDKMLAQARRLLKDELGFALDESISDFQILNEFTDNQAVKSVKLLCVFAKKDAVDKYLQAVIACGLKAVRVSTGVFNYCGTLNSFSAGPVLSAILDIAGTHSCIAIYQDGKLYSVKVLEFSTEKLRAALVGVLPTNKGMAEITIQKAKELLQEYGIPFDEPENPANQIKPGQIAELIRPLAENLILQLQEFFAAFRLESGQDSLGLLYITGGGANLKNLDTYLAARLKIKVKELPLPESLDTSRVDAEQLALASNQLSGVLGLGLVSSGINLLPPVSNQKKRRLIRQSTLWIIGGSLVVLAIFFWALINYQAAVFKKTLDATRNPAKIAVVPPAEVIQVKEKAPEPDTYPEVALTGILWDKQAPLAIVNGKIIGRGQRVDRWTVKEIEADRLFLSDGQLVTEVKLKH